MTKTTKARPRPTVSNAVFICRTDSPPVPDLEVDRAPYSRLMKVCAAALVLGFVLAALVVFCACLGFPGEGPTATAASQPQIMGDPRNADYDFPCFGPNCLGRWHQAGTRCQPYLERDTTLLATRQEWQRFCTDCIPLVFGSSSALQGAPAALSSNENSTLGQGTMEDAAALLQMLDSSEQFQPFEQFEPSESFELDAFLNISRTSDDEEEHGTQSDLEEDELSEAGTEVRNTSSGQTSPRHYARSLSLSWFQL